MHFSIVFKILAFVLSVNAISIKKRDIVSIPAQTCIDGLISITQKLDSINALASDYTAANGYIGMLTIFNLFSQADNITAAASTSCCAITSTLIDSDATAVLSEESTVANSFISMTSTFINIAKPQIDQVLLMTAVTGGEFSNLRNAIAPLLNCLTAMMPPDSMNTAQGYSTSILNSLQQDIATFTTTAITSTTTAITSTTTAATSATTAIISPTA